MQKTARSEATMQSGIRGRNISEEPVLEKVRAHFRSFLKEGKQRQTPERFAILDEIYSEGGHFDADELYVRLKNRGEQISRATVYNTLDLLLECNLVIKHQFGHSQAKYEKSFHYRQHDHLICLDCGHVLEYCDPRIQSIRDMVGSVYNFDIVDHSLHMFGKCLNDPCSYRSTTTAKE